MRLRPAEFWDLTPAELGNLVDAFKWGEERRDEADYYRTAWLAAHLMNATGNYRQTITPDKLLGRKKAQSQPITPEERDKAIQELLEKFNKG